MTSFSEPSCITCYPLMEIRWLQIIWRETQKQTSKCLQLLLGRNRIAGMKTMCYGEGIFIYVGSILDLTPHLTSVSYLHHSLNGEHWLLTLSLQIYRQNLCWATFFLNFFYPISADYDYTMCHGSKPHLLIAYTEPGWAGPVTVTYIKRSL